MSYALSYKQVSGFRAGLWVLNLTLDSRQGSEGGPELLKVDCVQNSTTTLEQTPNLSLYVELGPWMDLRLCVRF